MRTVRVLGLLGIFFLFPTMQAQTEVPIQDLLARLQQNHMGSLLDVFSPEELQRVHAHLNPENEEESRGGGSIRRLYGAEAISQSAVSVDLEDVAALDIINVATAIDFEGAAGVNQSNLTIRGIDNSNNAYTVDKLSGVYTQMGVINAPAGESWTGIEYNPVNGMWYGISTDGQNNISHISMIDWSGMTATPIGNTGLRLPIALAIDDKGVGYTYDIDDDNAYSIDLNDASVSLLGSIGFDANFGQGMAWDPNSQQLYLAALNAAITDTEIRTMNPVTGNTTLIGRVEPGFTTQPGYGTIPLSSLLETDDVDLAEFKFYPNPATDRINLSNPMAIDEIGIFDLLGRKVLSQKVDARHVMLDVSSLNTGTYVMTVTSGSLEQSYKLMIR